MACSTVGGRPSFDRRCRVKFVMTSGFDGFSRMYSRLWGCEYSQMNEFPKRSAIR